MCLCAALGTQRSRAGHTSTFITDYCSSEAVRKICAENAVELIETSPETLKTIE